MAEPVSAEDIRGDIFLLFDQDVRYPNWEQTNGVKNAFYVRGFTWFRDEVLEGRLNVTDGVSYIPMMKKELADRTAWHVAKFRWTDPFGGRQFIDTASSRSAYAPNFQKAVEIVLLCEIIARELRKKNGKGPSADDVLLHMHIEPALSFIHDFNLGVWETLTPGERTQLRQWTGQPGNNVFVEMANGNTVTHKLAERTKRFFERQKPNVDLGDVSFHYRKGNLAKSEHIDVKEADLPVEARR